MSQPAPDTGMIVVVTGANGLVGARTCAALVERGATVRAVVRREGTAPALEGVEEHVGDFYDPQLAEQVVRGAGAVVTTVHPMGTDRDNQHRVAVLGTPVIARAARDAGVDRLVHVSTVAVYDFSPETGDVAEGSPLVADDAGDYAVTKRDTDAALAQVSGLTSVILRPPAILGRAESSVWNSVQPKVIRDNEQARHANPDRTFPWVHVDDLAAFTADVAVGRVDPSPDPDQGPVAGSCTIVNVTTGSATARDYYETVTGAVGVQPVWESGPAWTGRIPAERARSWGWVPRVGLAEALAEIDAGLRT